MDPQGQGAQTSGERRSVAGIARRDGAVFIARRIPGGAMGEKWEFPGGKVEPGESDQEALRREYLEEFGVGVSVGPLAAQASFEHKSQDHGLYAYIIRMADGHYTLSEHTEWRWAALEEIDAMNFADSDRKLLPQLRRFFASHPLD
jgi:8-oxo-dGTP diphosphatase